MSRGGDTNQWEARRDKSSVDTKKGKEGREMPGGGLDRGRRERAPIVYKGWGGKGVEGGEDETREALGRLARRPTRARGKT